MSAKSSSFPLSARFNGVLSGSGPVKNFRSLRSVTRLIIVASLLLTTVGCWGTPDPAEAVRAVNKTNAQRLANLYQQHQRENRGFGPKDEAAFKGYIAGINPVLLSRIDVEPGDLAGLFVSERDEKPFVIRYGQRGNDMGEPVAIVFESEGVDGKRVVAFTRMVVKEVESSEYDELFKSKS